MTQRWLTREEQLSAEDLAFVVSILMKDTFLSAATLKSLKGNPNFKGLFDLEDFRQIEQLIASSLDESN